MSGFKEIAFDILKEKNKPLHSKEITKIALERGWLKTAGKTPAATMNALLIVDINSKKEKSRFIKTAPSTFALNNQLAVVEKKKEIPEKIYRISKDVSSKQKGDIAEARIAELIILYGDTTLSCYKPISDDEGIDLIVKEKGSLKTMYIQIKSRFGDNPEKVFTATTKKNSITNKYSMAVVFCFFDTEVGDLWDYLWFVPAPELIEVGNTTDNSIYYWFVAGTKKNEENKWDEYLIDKRDLANKILEQMSKIG